jgi:hypothetical protein
VDIYSLSTLLGMVGFGSMALLGTLGGHHSSRGSHSHAGQAGHANGHAGHANGHAGHANGSVVGHVGHKNSQHSLASSRVPHTSTPPPGFGRGLGVGLKLLELLAPRMLFSLALGFGLTGILLRSSLPSALVLVAAIFGAIAFEMLLIAPAYRFAMQFASKPALSLESATLSRAKAVMDFDAHGDGLIELELNGEIRQILGTLEGAENTAGIAVKRGDMVRVMKVNSKNGRCTVSRIEA